MPFIVGCRLGSWYIIGHHWLVVHVFPLSAMQDDRVLERSIMNQTGHRSSAMVRRHIRDGSLFRENAAANVGF
jgi:hypothetical protein